MTRTIAPITASVQYGYHIELTIVDRQICSHAHCTHCQRVSSVVEAEVYLPIEAGDGHLTKKHLECCCACVLPAIDGEPYVATDQTIVVEVYRGATLRPF